MASSVAYYPGGYDPAAPAQNRAEALDNVAGTYTSWDKAGAQTAQRPLTAKEAQLLAALDAANAVTANADTLRTKAEAAAPKNEAFIANAKPTADDVAVQLHELTAQVNVLRRIALGKYDSLDGTDPAPVVRAAGSRARIVTATVAGMPLGAAVLALLS